MSLDEFSNIELTSYPVQDKDYNLYCKKFNSFKTLYNAMLNGFDNDEIKIIIEEHLRIYFEKFEKALQCSSKIENEASALQ